MKRKNSLVLLASADARVDTVRGSVVVTTAEAKPFAICEKEAISIFGPECYHRNDYGFFYNNLKQNIADRIKAALENNDKTKL